MSAWMRMWCEVTYEEMCSEHAWLIARRNSYHGAAHVTTIPSLQYSTIGIRMEEVNR